jgi:hypothetical protein
MIALLAERRTARPKIKSLHVIHGDRDAEAVVKRVDLCDGDVPDDGWTLDELTARTVAELQVIEQAEQAPTRHYWFQGKAINAARKRFKRSASGNYLKTCRISKDQARSARKLAKWCGSPNELMGLSVRAVPRLAKGEPADPGTARLLRNLEARLRKLSTPRAWLPSRP